MGCCWLLAVFGVREEERERTERERKSERERERERKERERKEREKGRGREREGVRERACETDRQTDRHTLYLPLTDTA